MNYNEDLSQAAEEITLTISDVYAGERLDAALAALIPEYSRSRIAEWIKEGRVRVNEQIVAGKNRIIGGEKVVIHPYFVEDAAFQAENIALDILYEDAAVLVINKPAGLVVHPAAGNWQGTLLNGLLGYDAKLSSVPRAGIVHRLDKDTSGLMVVAKTVEAQTDLVRQLQARSVKRLYRAIANGQVPYDGSITTLIGRDPHHKLRMAVVKFGGKEAITHVTVLEDFISHTYIECALETGRTHQIRVHMREAGHPLAGDPLYGGREPNVTTEVRNAIDALGRQALHAYRLEFIHPLSHKTVHFEAALPEDMRLLLTALRHAKEENQPQNENDDDVEVFYV